MVMKERKVRLIGAPHSHDGVIDHHSGVLKDCHTAPSTLELPHMKGRTRLIEGTRGADPERVELVYPPSRGKRDLVTRLLLQEEDDRG